MKTGTVLFHIGSVLKAFMAAWELKVLETASTSHAFLPKMDRVVAITPTLQLSQRILSLQIGSLRLISGGTMGRVVLRA
jgi:hypothetical protein